MSNSNSLPFVREKHLVPTFRRLGIESGFSVENPAFLLRDQFSGVDPSPDAQFSVRVEVLRRGNVIYTRELPISSNQSFLTAFESDLEIPQPQNPATDPEDVITIEYLMNGKTASAHPFFIKSIDKEAQTLYRPKSKDWYASVNINQVTVRPPGHVYTPILHPHHYSLLDDDVTTYMCLVSYQPEKPGDLVEDQNAMELKIYSDTGELLGVKKQAVPHNSVVYLNVDDLLAEVGARGKTKNPCVAVRGGASQFAIYTFFHNRRNGTIGVEHSLPPVAYTDAPLFPEKRKLFYKKALQGIWTH